MSSANQNVGRDELAAMLGASHASDMVAAAGTTANDLSKGGGPAGTGTAGSRKQYGKGGVDAEEDVSKMDRAQAAALVARKFAGGGAASSAGAGAVGVTRHRAAGKRKRMLQHHLLAGDLMEKEGVTSVEAVEDVARLYQKGQPEEEEEESFEIRADAMAARRKKSEATVLLRKRGDGKDRRRRSSSSSDSDSSDRSSSSSSSDSAQSRSRGRNRNKGRRNRRSRSNSSSSSEDEADVRRRRARERAQKNQQSEGNVVSSDHGANGTKPDGEIIDEVKQQNTQKNGNEDDMLVDEEKENEKKQKIAKPLQEEEEVSARKNRQKKPARRARSDSSSSSNGSSSSSESSSSSDDSSSEDSHQNSTLPMSIPKPLFIPKSKRGTVAKIEAEQQKLEEAEQRRAKEAEKRAVQSRALVAETVSSAGKAGVSHDNEGDEFDTGEAGGEFIHVPDDTDPTEETPEKVLAERDAWEVRELIRILRDVDEALEREKERKELGRRRALTDGERLEEDKRSGRYRAPGEARRRQRQDANDGKGGDNNYLQRFHHRGAFYMDEDTLQNAGENDVRHRAAEYSRAATGEDKINKSALPEVMQVKNFGFAGSTKYKGLAKEDTTDRKMDFLPIRGKGGAFFSAAGRGGQRNNGGGSADRERYR
eukprot:CAMPEP_0172298734 /NCGR_PEP_ID=MMETSP1058-20130122/1252_1 /TAXON_ID=83371 /ORGANISM="Detonula confervacea, Strain CCMP 353" /LENGTH=649 /DNA_ID=CAMNT_0013008023 /DNA_START=34 /DNA_END=1983 /DNA_ORIENTATION=-